MSETPKVTKIEIAIANIKSDRDRIAREIALLNRENERLFSVQTMLENLEQDKLLA